MGSSYDPAYDGRVPRWRVRCGFECDGVRCPAVGECSTNPDAPRAREVLIFCRDHGREDGRTANGRHSNLTQYVMSLSKEDKKRARADASSRGGQRKKKKETAAHTRKRNVKLWLGSGKFKECSVFHSKMILSELRVPSLLLGGHKKGEPRSRVFLFDSFALTDLKYLFEKRVDGRMLYLVRGSSIIRCDIVSFVGHAWYISQKQ